jgi:hypothetical protein
MLQRLALYETWEGGTVCLTGKSCEHYLQRAAVLEFMLPTKWNMGIMPYWNSNLLPGAFTLLVL